VLEAMAYALPVLVTDIDGNNELLKAVKCGFLFEKLSDYFWVGKVLNIMNMTVTARKALGESGRQYLKTEFSEASVMQQWKALIEKTE
jgi:glycosyltransferase involved in cell wall biosynthesis